LAFWRNQAGVAAVEFALILPSLLLLYVGTVEVGQGLTVARKLNNVAVVTADLMAQSESLSTTDMTDIFAAAKATLAPYDAGGLKIQACVVATTGTTQTVAWCAAENDTAPGKGAAPPVAIPSALIETGVEMVVVRTRYHLDTPFSSALSVIGHGYDFQRVYVQRPRIGDAIDKG
jgi:Flp pilus assembly protein TadG